MDEGLRKLRPEQHDLLGRWVPDAEVLTDHSWGLVDTVVLELSSEQGRLVLKAGGPADAHIGREIRAHQEWLGPWAATGHAPRLLYGDASAKVLVTRYLPGQLLEGTPAQDDPDTYPRLANYWPGTTVRPRFRTLNGMTDSARESSDISITLTASIQGLHNWSGLKWRRGREEDLRSCRLTAIGSPATG